MVADLLSLETAGSNYLVASTPAKLGQEQDQTPQDNVDLNSRQKVGDPSHHSVHVLMASIQIMA